MRKTFSKTMLLLMAALLLFSCEKYNDTEGESSKEANSTLVIRTRADVENNDAETKVSYPIHIYIFNSEGKCAELKTINDAETQMSVRLPEGDYNVYAIAGADAESYNLPTKENATRDAVISLKEGKEHGDLMTARNSVNLMFGEKNTLTLTLSRKVMQIKSVTINNVPSAVNAVSVTIGPLYKNILLDGNYQDGESFKTINLTKQDDAGTWKNNTEIYLLEASAPATIKVAMTTNSGTTSYSYSSPDELKANYKMNITGTYTEQGVTLSGVIEGAAWAGEKNIVFNFNESGSTKEENPDEEKDDEKPGNAPQAGDVYEGCYVLTSETKGGTTTVVLIANNEKDRLTFTEDDQESLKAAVNEGISELSIDGISGWRVPTLAEIEYIAANHDRIYEDLRKNSMKNFYTGDNYFYCLAENGDIVARSMSSSEFKPYSNSSKHYLRAFATVTFNNQQ